MIKINLIYTNISLILLCDVGRGKSKVTAFLNNPKMLQLWLCISSNLYTVAHADNKDLSDDDITMFIEEIGVSGHLCYLRICKQVFTQKEIKISLPHQWKNWYSGIKRSIFCAFVNAA